MREFEILHIFAALFCTIYCYINLLCEKISYCFGTESGQNDTYYGTEILVENNIVQAITLEFAYMQIGTTKPLPWSLAAVLLP